jgi:hypothetical protein
MAFVRQCMSPAARKVSLPHYFVLAFAYNSLRFLPFLLRRPSAATRPKSDLAMSLLFITFKTRLIPVATRLLYRLNTENLIIF